MNHEQPPIANTETEWPSIEGLLLGTAIGDALGLAAEGIRPSRIHKLWSDPWTMRIISDRGTDIDDTNHFRLNFQ